MKNTMRDEFMKLLNQMDSVNVEDTPRFKVMKALCDSLKKTGCFEFPTIAPIVGIDVDEKLIASIVGNMVIDVDENFVNDTELFNRSIETYTNILVKMREKTKEINPYLFEQIISGGEPITLTYKES